jgi:hypothetical protein
MKFLPLLVLAGSLALGACANGDHPPQQAYLLNKEYQAGANVALGVVQSPAVPDKVKSCIKVADNIAFNYVTQATNQAKDWNNAPDDQKPAELTLFQKIYQLGLSAVGNVSAIVNGKGDCSVALGTRSN